MLTTLLLSMGTPMLLAGDEFGRTQQGNNNAYCQDNEISWLDWSLLDQPAGRELATFVGRLTEIRRQHPVIRAAHFLHGREELAQDLRDIDWFDERGLPLSEQDWGNPQGKALVLRRAGRRPDGKIDIIALLMNGSPVALDYRLAGVFAWHVLIDSAVPAEDEAAVYGDSYRVQAGSAVVLKAVIDAS
jgi:glycogen operon protein